LITTSTLIDKLLLRNESVTYQGHDFDT